MSFTLPRCHRYPCVCVCVKDPLCDVTVMSMPFVSWRQDQYQFVYKAVLEAYSGYSSRVLLDGSNIVLPFLSESLYEQVDAELQASEQ